MQIPKPFLAVCAAALGISSVAYGQDSDEQAKAREAMREKVGQLEAGGATSVPQPLAPAPQSVPPASQPVVAPVSSSAPVSVATPVSVSSEEQDRARQAMREKVEQLEAGAPTPVPQSVAQAREEVPQPVPQVTSSAAPSIVTITMDEDRTASDPQAIEKAREQMRQKIWELEHGPGQDTTEVAKAREANNQKLQELESAPATAHLDQAAQTTLENEEAAAAAQRRAKRAQVTNPTTEYQRLEPPPSLLSGTQQERLAELLRRYRADEITPEQYHAERAKILAEPQ